MVGTVHKHDRVRWAWRVLGLDTNPSYDSIRAAYCRLAVTTHPDRCTDLGAKEKFQALHAAYETALENHAQTKNTGRSAKNGGRADFDWRAEVARVREAYSSMFKYQRRPEAAAAAAAATPWWKQKSTPPCAAPQQSHKRRHSNNKNAAKAPMRGANVAAAATGIASVSAPAEDEECRGRATEARRRRGLPLAQQLICRIVSREAARRSAIMRLAQNERRGIFLSRNEERIRHAIEKWETASWANMNEQWAEVLTCSGHSQTALV
ncbi:chaperone DnaJ protein [Trypanosoma conorhini]|uniref:Chaperone DnaJ protein n=1 Tax=Trypanosoma conorhini TaxID=83891 RepID=A0A422QAN6_9TRYP|nr:chaperone DnaJ protein [Trypanosoma conorhini]RNF27017.1 chaperone DnaJ protein [Trypanosoma conorhini]